MLVQPTYLGKEIPEIAFHRSHVSGSNGAVTAPNPFAAKAGLEILKAGGNAVDAAAATWLVISVKASFQLGRRQGSAFSSLPLLAEPPRECLRLQVWRQRPSIAYWDLSLHDA